MSNLDKRALREAAEKAISEEGETWWNEDQLASDYGLALHRTDAKFIASANPATVLALLDELEAAEKRIAELEAREKSLRTVGVMSQKAYQRLEGRESRFIALWPRPEIYLPRKRPDDGVIVYARVAGAGKGA